MRMPGYQISVKCIHVYMLLICFTLNFEKNSNCVHKFACRVYTDNLWTDDDPARLFNSKECSSKESLTHLQHSFCVLSCAVVFSS